MIVFVFINIDNEWLASTAKVTISDGADSVWVFVFWKVEKLRTDPSNILKLRNLAIIVQIPFENEKF